MAIAYVANISYWSGVGPQSAGSYTPSAGNTIIENIEDRSGTGRTGVLTSTVGSYTKLSEANGLDGTTNSGWSQIGVSGAAQILTVNSSPSGDFVIGVAWEFSGIGSTSATQSNTSSSSTTTNSIVGTAISVPVGSVLYAVCIDTTRAIGNAAIADAAATSVYANGFDMVGETYAGAGSNITPLFTPRAATATNYTIFQFLLTPPVLTSSDIYQGLDTYGWIESSTPQLQAMRASIASQWPLQTIQDIPPYTRRQWWFVDSYI